MAAMHTSSTKTTLFALLVSLSLLLATPAAGRMSPSPSPSSSAHDDHDDDDDDGVNEFISAVISNPQLSLLTKSLKDTKLDVALPELLKSGITVFAPTDDAFLALGSKLLDCLSKEPGRSEILKPILLYHVVPGKLTAEDIKTVMILEMAQGSSLLVTNWDGKVMVNHVNVILADAITSSASVAHVIDGVLVPKEVLPTIQQLCLC